MKYDFKIGDKVLLKGFENIGEYTVIGVRKYELNTLSPVGGEVGFTTISQWILKTKRVKYKVKEVNI